MASYINKKDRVFYPAGDCPPLQFHRQRPEACLKTYYSCTDTRVWELAEEPRRQHLREILSTPVVITFYHFYFIRNIYHFKL